MKDRTVLRIRHEPRRRELVVAAKDYVTPHYLSIRFRSDEFGDFVSAAADDHIKLFIPDAPPEDGKPPMRDYTPRAFDLAKGELVIDFALHDDPGPATAWAMGANVGDTISIGGPRGSVVIPDSYDWYWLIGDETAIPAILRRAAEWPHSKMSALIAVFDRADEVSAPEFAGMSLEWVHRPQSAAHDASPFLERLRDWEFPAGDGFVWIAAEAGVAKSLRQYLLAKGHPLTQMKAAGYWTFGQADTTERFD